MRSPTSMVFALAAVALLTTSCTLRYARSTFTEPLLDDAATGIAVEGGLYFWDGVVYGERADVALFGTYQQFDFFTDALATHVEFRGRWFPLPEGLVDPFVGGGLGVYRLQKTERHFNCRSGGICLTEFGEARGQATGLTPHLTVGAELRPADVPGALLLAVTREFGVFDPEWDLSAWRISGGLSFRPK